MQELLSKPLGTVFTPTQRHTIRTSYYNNHTSVQSEAIRQPAQCVVDQCMLLRDATHNTQQGFARQHGGC